MDDSVFPTHALDEMSNHGVSEDDVYRVVGDYDEEIPYDNGRTETSARWRMGEPSWSSWRAMIGPS